jgi:hypothetical protein
VQPADAGEPNLTVSSHRRPGQDGIIFDIKRVPYYFSIRELGPDMLLSDSQVGARDEVAAERCEQRFAVPPRLTIVRPPAMVIRLAYGYERASVSYTSVYKVDWG